jgi:hypothetical protein
MYARYIVVASIEVEEAEAIVVPAVIINILPSLYKLLVVYSQLVIYILSAPMLIEELY